MSGNSAVALAKAPSISGRAQPFKSLSIHVWPLCTSLIYGQMPMKFDIKTLLVGPLGLFMLELKSRDCFFMEKGEFLCINNVSIILAKIQPR